MDLQSRLTELVQAAAHDRTPLNIQGGNSKAFYGREPTGFTLDVSGHRGITAYTPSELVISARAGTTLAELEDTLAAQGQMLAFEPPRFGDMATIGGTIACGLSGPRRPWAGAARDFVLGVNCINGKGEYLRFGGQVMKNVAGYDISRMLTGSLGTLAVLLEIHLKVLPRPAREITQYFACSAADAIRRCCEWSAQAVPVSAACYHDGQLMLRLSGTERGVSAALRQLGGETLDDSNHFWLQLREQQLMFFDMPVPLWRISVPAACRLLPLDGDWLYDWGGALRWYSGPASAAEVQQAALAVGGHATLFRNGVRSGEVFQPLPPVLRNLHARLKHSFDPHGILNPGRMYAGL
jgi:glycolate oxidase FAD binding subunit